MNFSWWTFGLQAANFLVLVWLLQRFLFKPVKGIVARRREEIGRTLAEATAQKQTAERLRQEIEAQKSQMETERQQLLERQTTELSVERQKILEQARAEADKLKSQVEAQLEQERVAADSELFEHSVQLAIALAEKLLREIAVPSLDYHFIVRALDHVDGLPATDRSTLLSELGASPVVLTTAHPIGAEQQAEWCERFAKQIGTKNVRFAADPALIAGAKIELAHSILSFNWRDSLAAAGKELQVHS
jgi:F-type H+-transporting ATPase subunit b